MSRPSSKSYEWPNGANLALSVVVNIEEGAEMSILDGDSRPEPVDEMGIALNSSVRNLGNESNYAYGINEGLSRVCSILDDARVPVTWTAAAVSLERSSQVAETIGSRRQDEVASHGLRWIHQYRMQEEQERQFITDSADLIQALVGKRPRGYLSRYLTTLNTRRILAEEGFLYHMDDYSRDEPFWDETAAGPIVVMPYAIDTNDMKMWLHPSLSPRAWSEYADATLQQLVREGASQPRLMSLGLHLRIIGRPGRIGELERLLTQWSTRDDIWFATREDIAEHFALTAPGAVGR